MFIPVNSSDQLLDKELKYLGKVVQKPDTYSKKLLTLVQSRAEVIEVKDLSGRD